MPHDPRAREKRAENLRRKAKDSPDEQIRAAVEVYVHAIKSHQRLIEAARLSLQHVREDCPHNDKEQWTNNDGYGQFIVERCKVCGLQKDGGLK